MPTPTYTPLAEITLGSNTSSVTFSSISQAYRDLVVVTSHTTVFDAFIGVRFNSDSGANYNTLFARGNGTSASSSSRSNDTQFYPEASTILASTTANPNLMTFNIMDYSASDKHKTVLSRLSILKSSGSDTGTNMAVSRWASNSVITSVSIFAEGDNFKTGSTFALYGIAS